MLFLTSGPRSPLGRAAWRAVLVGGVAGTVANCSSPTVMSSGKHASELKYGVTSSPRVIPEGEPIPKGGGRAMVGQPYVVAGRTYVPTDGKGYKREGWASWYGTAFHGRLTANGEIFDRESVAAAHPTLPLPSYVRVTNVVNGKSMVVRVNDRGPYEQNRLIDLSERAAEALDFRRRGTTRVAVQYLGPAPLAGSDDIKLLATLQTHPQALPPKSLLASLGLPDLNHMPAPAEPKAPVRLAALTAQPAKPVLSAMLVQPAKSLQTAKSDRKDPQPLPKKIETAGTKAEPSRAKLAQASAKAAAPTAIRTAENLPPRRPTGLRPAVRTSLKDDD